MGAQGAVMQTELLVIGAGPYALATAAYARDRSVATTVVGRPMAFWRENMPADMFLRSGPDWHLDAGYRHTLEAYLEERGIAHEDVDPMPIAVFLDYADWFRQVKGLEVRGDLVDGLLAHDGGFEATLASGERLAARFVLAAPGIRHYSNFPDWAPSVPPQRCAHTCDLVALDELAGKRVLIVGGRQSAYEWAALAREHGAIRVDIVHRHAVPRFERVSWKFVDPHVERTVAVRGYWRNLPETERDAIARRFWEVGRLTLEHWLTPRLEWDGLTRWPDAAVVAVTQRPGAGDLEIVLSNSARLTVDRVVFASGYRANLENVPYLAGLLHEIRLREGFPVLDEAFQTTLPGLYITGFSATNDFGPFFGFVKGAPAAATLVVSDILART
jgi:cation diffusion facilitator CzcD-associated flavoprotein CzcO